MPGRQIKIRQNNLSFLFITLVLILTASVIGYLFRDIGFPETNIVIVYLLAVLLTSFFTNGYLFGILASIIATFAFNYFFTEPYYSFSVYDPGYFITFAVMTAISLITGTQTSRIKQNALAAYEREAETKVLFRLSNRLTNAKNMQDISSIAADAASHSLKCNAACLCFDENGIPEPFFIQQESSKKQIQRETENSMEIKHQIDGLRTDYSAGKEFFDWVIKGKEMTLGIIRIPRDTAEQMTLAQTRLFHSMVETIGLAMDQFRSAQQRIQLRQEAIQERYRSNLLRAISHDLRTPLSSIIGTCEILMDMSRPSDPRYSLAEEIHKDADWLHSLVENILSLTHLQDGKLSIHKQLEAAEEIIGSAVNHVSKHSPEYEITVSIPNELLFVPMDAKLIEQVFINLLDNAIKNTMPDNEIGISVTKDKPNHQAVFSVYDRGRGIPDSDLPNLFQAFFTSGNKPSDGQRGIGLGLTICDAIIKAHGGTIEAHNRKDGSGAEFIFTLPLEEKNHEPL